MSVCVNIQQTRSAVVGVCRHLCTCASWEGGLLGTVHERIVDRQCGGVQAAEKMVTQCKATAEVGDFVAMYPSMGQNYVTNHAL